MDEIRENGKGKEVEGEKEWVAAMLRSRWNKEAMIEIVPWKRGHWIRIICEYVNRGGGEGGKRGTGTRRKWG